jgi:hypothetical protein
LVASFVFGRFGSGYCAVGEWLCGRSVLDVSLGFNQRDQLEIYPQLQYRRAGVASASGRDLLFDLCCITKV